MRNDDQKTSLILTVCGILPVVWLALLTAPYVSGGLVEIIRGIPVAMGNPLEITMCEDSVKTVLIFLLAYAMGIGVYFSTRRNYRRREEHGSAKWGNAGALNKKYRDKDPSANKLLTQNVRIGLDGKKHRRNLNILVCGGSGAGKTRFFCKPNAMQCNTSFVILDPKGEIVRDIGGLLENKGYEVRVLDLINMHRSHCYNPFVYLRNDNDVQRLVTNLFKATTPKGSQSQDPFWDTAASMLLLALVFYLKYEAPPDEQNFPMVMELLRAGEVREDDDSYVSPLDELFDRLEMVNPEHIALKYYRDYHSGSAKTLKSIQITLAARLEKFNLESLAGLTATDELDLTSLGEKKVALFALIPDNDTSFNFLVSILYTQLFQQLFYLADHKYGGSLPVHCHFIMDEFANVSLPDDFDKILSVMRSRGVSVSIILQNLAQLKALFEKQLSLILSFSTLHSMYAFDGNGAEETGKAAVEIDKQIALKYEGKLTDNKVQQMMSEFKPTQDLHGMNAKYIYQNALQSSVFSHFADIDGNWNGLSVADVFGDKEIKVGYVNGWLSTSQNMAKIFIVLSLVIILLIAPVFSGEYGGVDNIILTSKYGKTKCATAKVLASLLSAVFITTLVVIFNLLIAVAIYGTEGLDCSILFAPIDFLEGYIPFNITCGTVLKYQILLAFMSAISVTGIVLILSAVCKSQMIAFVISAAIHVIPIMLPISETSALYRIIVLMPLFYSQYISIMSVEQMHNGMLYAVWSIPVAIALVVIGSIISHKAFSKHQVR